jgi:hypothetical protein
MKFFDLKNYYVTNFNLLNVGNMNLGDIENMLFWERDIYTNLLIQHNKKIKNSFSENPLNNIYE